MKKDGKFLSAVLIILCVTLVAAVIPTDAEAAIYEDTVRLHIRARSDSETDQAVKLTIRDKILEKYAYTPTPCSKNEAEAMIYARLSEIEDDVNFWLEELGCEYGCEVRLTEEWFETRDYGEYSLPAGMYSSLIIELGGGEGQNWWCVMYPPMCHEVAIGKSVAYTGEETRLIYGGRYAVKFKLLELAASLAK